MRTRNKTNFSNTLAGRLSMLTFFTILAALAVSWFTVSRDMRLELDKLAVENISVRTAAFMKDLEETMRQNPGGRFPRNCWKAGPGFSEFGLPS